MNIKPTSEKAAEYWGFGKQCLELKAYGAKAVVDGLYTIVCKYTPDEAVLIAIGGGNFISTPRLLNQNDGYDEVLKPQGDGKLSYPLEDSSNTSQVLTTVDGVSVERSVHLYGNIDWTGPNTETPPESNAPVLTWKGPPSRYFPVSDTTVVSGLSVFDEEVTGPDGLPLSIFTCFGPCIYQDGEILATAPGVGSTTAKILGAAYHTTGPLLAILGTNYRGLGNPDGGTGGFYYEAYIVSGWKRVGYIHASRQKVPFFFNQSGTEAATIQDNILFTASFAKAANGDMTCVFTKDEKICEGVYSRSKTSTSTLSGTAGIPGSAYENPGDYPLDLVVTGSGTSRLTANRTETCKVAVDYQGDVRVFALTQRNDSEVSVGIESGSSTYELAPVYADTAPESLSALTVNYNPGGGVEVGIGSTYSVNGGCGAVRWSASGAVISDQGILVSVSCTSGERAEVTVTATDGTGATISRSDPTYGASTYGVITFQGGVGRMSDCYPPSTGATTTVNTVSGADYTESIYADVNSVATKCDCEGYVYDSCYPCASPPCSNMLIWRQTITRICV